jgi:carboxyl-terminal processing protease
MPPLVNRDRAGAVKLTIQKFYRVAGSSTQKLGVVPDIILPSVRDALEVGEKYADHALDYDKIRRAQDLKPYNRQNLFLSMLADKNAKRVAASEGLCLCSGRHRAVEKRMEENKVSLNMEKRKNEIAEADARRKSRNAETTQALCGDGETG